VYSTMRNLGKKDKLEAEAGATLNKNLFIRQLDVCDDASVTNLVQDVLKIEGRIDILVNNAGVGLSGLIELQPVAMAKENFETNFFGVYRMTAAVIPTMKTQNSGHIIQVTSMGGILGVPFNEIYCASKFAVEGFTESLAPWLKNFNIKFTLIEPGPIFTDFITNTTAASHLELITPEKVDEKTLKLFTTFKQRMLANFTPEMGETPKQVAEKIQAAIEDVNSAFRIQTNPTDAYKAAAKAKLTDVTGNSNIEVTLKRFFQ